MILRESTTDEIKEMQLWFATRESILTWAGPQFRFPFTFSTFCEDLKLDSEYTYSFLDTENTHLGFGQFYERWDRCHLSRVVINPKHRQKGLGSVLVNLLCQYSASILQKSEFSLFVLDNNLPALNTYQSVGFKEFEPPQPIDLPHCIYMVKK